jgi:hypothetical protein
LAFVYTSPKADGIVTKPPNQYERSSTVATMTPFRLGGFYDVPRYITLIYCDKMIFLRSEFDDDLDDYPNSYSVYVIPESFAASVTAGSWEFRSKELVYIGEILIADVRFDSRDFKELDASCLDRLLKDRAVPPANR